MNNVKFKFSNMQTNNNGKPLTGQEAAQTTNYKGSLIPMVYSEPVTETPLPYNSDKLRNDINELLNNPDMFATLNADFIPDYSQDGKEVVRYMATFTQQYAVRKIEEQVKRAKPVFKLVHKQVYSQPGKNGDITNMEEAGTDEKGNLLYSPALIKEADKWEAVKFEPMCYQVPTKKVLVVFFDANKGLSENKIAVYAVNTLALVCENYEIQGKAIPVRKTAGLNLSFGKVNTSKLGEGIRAGMMFTDLSRFTDLMLRRIALCDNAGKKAELKAGIKAKVK
jgi:hypothetical protein